jgi:hypothetical protein
MTDAFGEIEIVEKYTDDGLTMVTTCPRISLNRTKVDKNFFCLQIGLLSF